MKTGEPKDNFSNLLSFSNLTEMCDCHHEWSLHTIAGCLAKACKCTRFKAAEQQPIEPAW